MTITEPSMVTTDVVRYLQADSVVPLFIRGDAREILPQLPSDTIDCCMTSPPYWGHREYQNGGIGLETSLHGYVSHLERVFWEVRRVLKPTGSLWLNLGDAYHEKCLQGVPWRVAFALMDNQGWVLRNSVVWNKVKGGPDTAPDRLRNVHENIFHLVKSPRDYFYNVDAIRNSPKSTKVVNGAVVSATGVSGVRYKRQIELSTNLDGAEKAEALEALNQVLREMQEGKVADFRMVIRGQQRATHSDSETVSGRARELRQKGFYFLKYDVNGTKPSDVWDILPEDTQGRGGHFAPYPEDLCRIPIVATCPENGVVLDPFSGTGTTMFVAHRLGRKSIGIDISEEYIEASRQRCNALL